MRVVKLRRGTKAAALRAADFKRRVLAIVTPLGAVALPEGRPHGYRLSTKLGPLHFTIYEDWVAARFECVAAAEDYYGAPTVNRFSGKWNHHLFSSQMTRAEYAAALEPFFQRLAADLGEIADAELRQILAGPFSDANGVEYTPRELQGVSHASR